MLFIEELKRRNVFRVALAYGVAAWLLLQMADVLVPMLNLPDSAGRFVLLLLVIGFIPALIIAWAFELTPDGLKRESEIDRANSIAPKTGKKLDRIIIGGLILIIAGMGVERFWFAGETQPGQVQLTATVNEPAPINNQESVAVLPFTSMSSGEDDGYFADGLTEEILNSLAALPELLVTARTSSFHFKDQNLPVQQIAATLGVDHIVEGSVRRAGESVRITAQLIRASDGFHLWSNTYDRTLEDVFAVQADIAENIAATLDVVLDQEKRSLMRNSGIKDVDAFIAYQKGLDAFATAHMDMANISEYLKIAVTHFDTALAAAPDLAAARIMKADQKGHLLLELTGGFREESDHGELANALQALQEEYRLAIEATAPGNQKDILEFEAAIFSDDWSDISPKLLRALQPGACPGMNWSADFAISVGLGEQLITKLLELLRCDPFSIVGVYGLAGAYLHTGNPRESIRVANAAAARGVPVLFIDDLKFLAHLSAGDYDVLEVKGHGSGHALIPFSRQIPRQLLLGNTEAALQLAEEVFANPATSDWAAMLLSAMIGDRERANHHAALIDARPGSTIVLTNASLVCACGSPFDLDATPNLKARIEQSGFEWAPPTAIQFPNKDW